jgi:glycosyltransferase involved in cell wall biosynthesis
MITAYQGIIAPPAADPTPLIAGAACLLALHRGDALGLSVLRAMAFGVPVVTTDYGGCTDVLNPRTGFPVDFTNASTTFDTNAETWGESMVEADPDCAAWSLHDLFARPDLARARAAEAQRVIQTLYDPADVAAQQRRRLCRVKQLATRPYNGAAA